MKYISGFELENYDTIVVGSGLTGSIFARHFADCGKRVLIVEKRNHIAGNLYDYVNNEGILVQQYGPHALHTNSEEVNDFIHKYTETFPYLTRCAVYMHGKYTPSPFNFKTIDQFYSKEEAKALKEALLKEYPGRKQATIVELLESKNLLIKQYADFLFASDYSLYTAKQWGLKPSDIDPSVLKRVPVLFNYDEQYFYDKYQYMPVGGFTHFIESILNSENIDVILNHDFFEDFRLEGNSVFYHGTPITQKVVYTGPIDRLMNYKYGHLPYRSLRFEFKTFYKPSYQDAPITAYPEAEGYTRVTEYTKMPEQNLGKTTVAFEYPLPASDTNEPYYPILTKDSIKSANLYLQDISKYSNIIVCGRLGNFKYYNMDQAIAEAIAMIKNDNRVNI